MKSRYYVDRVDGTSAPAVIDRRRPRRDQVICFSVGVSMARRIAAALNQYEQRRLLPSRKLAAAGDRL